MKRNVGIFIFDDAEVLDFAGPFEVFSVSSQLHNYELFDVFTVGKNENIICAVNGLLVKPNYTFTNHPHIDILIIAGGQGTRKLLNDAEILGWIEKIQSFSEITMSICSGSRILGKIGLLDNRPFCTHYQVYDHMYKISPTAIPKKEKRFVQSAESIYTSGGISSGIDLSFHIVETLFGKEVAKNTSTYMEYTING